MPFQDRDDGSVYYLASTTAALYRHSAPDDARRPKDPEVMELLWGDRVRREPDGSGGFVVENGRWRVRARGQYGWVDPAHLGVRPLLELYFIDVGQGDGVLVRTPDGRHILIDGGWPRRGQPAGKNAADFVDWKFMRDYESPLKAIELDAIVCSHNDQDHYGGLWDLLDSTQWSAGEAPELDAGAVLVERIYHAGVSWWTGASGRTLGPVAETDEGDFLTQLLDDRAHVEAALQGAQPRLQGEWADFLRECAAAKTADGDPTPIDRLSSEDGFLPGFGPGGVAPAAGAVPEPVIHVLAPVAFTVDGGPAVRRFPGGTSKNTNGNSILLRVDCGRVRILLTGDLNTSSQQALIQDLADPSLFECDVAKACHHGSNDVSFGFLQAMEPQVTIISSGDSEGHDHPRPEIVAASAVTGYRTVVDDRMTTPLVFCTELARSTEIGRIVEVRDVDEAVQPPASTSLDVTRLHATAEVVFAGDRNPRSVQRRLLNRYLVTGTVYGLINVRTDGERIVCAALNEKERRWNVSELTPKPRP